MCGQVCMWEKLAQVKVPKFESEKHWGRKGFLLKTWSCDGGGKQCDEEAEERDILNRVLNSESEKKDQYLFFFFLIKNMEISRASQVLPVVKNLLANSGDTSKSG